MNNRLLYVLLSFFATSSLAKGQESWAFDFGKETHALSTNIVMDPLRYNNMDGFGFDFQNQNLVGIYTSEALEWGYCTAPVPFYFSVRVPEGNYRVNIRIGNPERKSKTTIKAEARRLMVSGLNLDAGEYMELQFNVSVRSPVLSNGDSIHLKPREYSYMNWDDRLSLEFSGKNQAVQHITIEPLDELISIFLAGNSTVCDQDLEPWASWGQMITPYFGPEVIVANYAESGESLSSFKSRGRLTKVLEKISAGDYLFIEFGHNDQKRKGEGIGPWTSYSDLLTEFAMGAREKGAIPVFLTPTQRRSFGKKRKITPSHGDYPAAMRAVAKEISVPLIDLNELTKVLYEAWGPRQSKKAFVHYRAGTFPGQEEALKDNTHFNAFGAHEVALCVLQGILDQEILETKYLQYLPAYYDPSRPNRSRKWKVPASPRYQPSTGNMP